MEHRDPDLPLTEFVYFRTDCDRPFYMIHPDTNERIYLNTRAAWWDEGDWHGGEPINRPTYTLRINGRFTEEFKKLIGVEGYDNEL